MLFSHTTEETLFEAGARLAAKDAILLRDLGIETVDVRATLSVALLATGSGIHDDRLADLDSPTVRAEMTHGVEISSEEFDYAIPVTLTDGNATPLGHVASPLRVYDGRFDPSVLSASTRATRADGFVVADRSVKHGDIVGVVPYEAVE